MELSESLLAVGRAGSGTNNIPIPSMSARGVPVFNAPGANARRVTSDPTEKWLMTRSSARMPSTMAR